MAAPCPQPDFLNQLFDAVILVKGGRVSWVNAAGKALLGVGDEIQGASLRLLSPEADEVFSSREKARYHFWRQRIDPVTHISRRDVFIADTRWLDASDGSLDGTLILRDATEVVILEKKLINTSFKDDRSGLLTAVGFAELAGNRFSRRRQQDGLTVMMALAAPELGNYEIQPAVHAEILRDVSIRIRDGLRGNDLAAYLGQNQFAIMLNYVPRLDLALSVAKRIAALVSAPFDCRGETVRLHTQVGIALLGTDGESTEPLLKAAQRACAECRILAGKYQAITFANKEIQKTAEYEAARAARIVEEIMLGHTRFDLLFFSSDMGRACLIRPSLPEFNEQEIWEAYEQEGMAADLVRTVIDRSSSVDCDYFVLSYPARHQKIGNNAMTLLAAERNMPLSRFFSCHPSIPDALPYQPAAGLAAVWDGSTSLSQLKAAGVALILAPVAEEQSLMNAELAVAKQFFKVFSREEI